mmetsp:Transcript_45592/g.62144  ORF Transcript_45592/g.62144 Transcript_45592/m.62144 type:complete len:91 (+) Transcript_45592:1063-1335(+)
MCCGGRIVSVLEGGYGSIPRSGKWSAHHSNQLDPTKQGTDGARKEKWMVDRSQLGWASAAHLSALVDPYSWNPEKLLQEGESQQLFMNER